MELLCLQKAAARERYEISIQEIEHDERQAQKKADELSTRDKEMELHKVMCLQFLSEINKSCLWQVCSLQCQVAFLVYFFLIFCQKKYLKSNTVRPP